MDRVLRSALESYANKHTQNMRAAAEAFCANSVSDLDAKMIPAGFPCCNLATGSTTIVLPLGTVNMACSRGMTLRPGTNGSYSELTPAGFVFCSSTGTPNNNLYPYDDGSTVINGIIQAPILSAANYIPRAFANQSVCLNLGMQNVVATSSGTVGNGVSAGTNNDISTFSAIRGPKRAPVGLYMTGMGPLGPYDVETLDTLCPLVIPSSNAPVPITDDVSPWYLQESNATWASPGRTAPGGAGNPLSLLFSVSTGTGGAANTTPWLANPSMPTLVDVDYSFDVVRLLTASATAYSQGTNSLTFASGGYRCNANGTLTSYNRPITAPWDYGGEITTTSANVTNLQHISGRQTLLVMPGDNFLQVVVSVIGAPLVNQNIDNFRLRFIRRGYQPYLAPMVFAQGLSSTSTTTIVHDAVWRVAATTQNSLVLGMAPVWEAAGELERDIQAAMTGSFGRLGMLTTDGAVGLPVTETNITPRILEVASPAPPVHPSGTFLAGLLPAIGSIASKFLPMIAPAAASFLTKAGEASKDGGITREEAANIAKSAMADLLRQFTSQTSVAPVMARTATVTVPMSTAKALEQLAAGASVAKKKKKKKGEAATTGPTPAHTGVTQLVGEVIVFDGDVPAPGRYYFDFSPGIVTLDGEFYKVASTTASVPGTYEMRVNGGVGLLQPVGLRAAASSTTLADIEDGGWFRGDPEEGIPLQVCSSTTLAQYEVWDVQRIATEHFCASGNGQYGIGVTPDGPHGGTLFQIFTTRNPVLVWETTDDAQVVFDRVIEYRNVGPIKMDERLYKSFRPEHLCTLSGSLVLSGLGETIFVNSVCNLDTMERDWSQDRLVVDVHPAMGGSLMASVVASIGSFLGAGAKHLLYTGTPFKSSIGPLVVTDLAEKQKVLEGYKKCELGDGSVSSETCKLQSAPGPCGRAVRHMVTINYTNGDQTFHRLGPLCVPKAYSPSHIVCVEGFRGPSNLAGLASEMQQKQTHD